MRNKTKILVVDGDLKLVQDLSSGERWIVNGAGWQSVALHHAEVDAIVADPSLMSDADLLESEE